jgi:hypothetical protein
MSDAPQLKRGTQADIWSYNLRAAKTNQDSDSDSDSNDNAATTNSAFESEEARFLKDLDLSSREETVIYKPNPFSIAKINAASRPTRASTPIIARRTSKPAQKKPQGRIVDSFNVKKKERLFSQPALSQQKATKRGPSANAQLRPTHAKRPTMTPALDPTSVVDVPAVSPVPTYVTDTMLSPPTTNVAFDHVLPLPSTHIPTTLASHNTISTRKFRPPAPVSFSSPLKAPPLHLRGSPASFNQNRLSLSSPLRPAQYALFPPVSAVLTSNKFMTQSKSRIGGSQPNSTFHPTMHGLYTPISIPATLTPSSESRFEPARGFQNIPTRSNGRPASEPRQTPSSSTPHRYSPAAATPLDFYGQDPMTTFSSNYYDKPSTPSAEPHSQSRAACHQRDLNLATHLPPSSPIRSPTATPSPSPRRKREPARKRPSPNRSTRTLKRQKSDAYDYLRSDPDDDWSTLPVRKKGKAAQVKPRISGIRTTAAFRLPGTKVTGMSATSQRRVVTFLPPPLKTGKVEVLVEDGRQRNGEQSAQLEVISMPSRTRKHSHESTPPIATPKRRRLAQNPYPSPATSRLTPGDATPPSSPAVIQPSTHRIPSPPTSDPLAEYDSDATAVALSSVSQRYPRTKGLMRQVRFVLIKYARLNTVLSSVNKGWKAYGVF